MTNTPPPNSPALEELLDRVQKATIAYFWDGGHPVSGLAYNRRLTWGNARNDLVSIGGSGFSLADFTQITRSKTVVTPVTGLSDIAEIVDLLLAPVFPAGKGIRLLGVTMSTLDSIDDKAEPQLALAL